MNKCKNCKKKFEPKYNSEELVCSIECAIQYSNSVEGKKYLDKVDRIRLKELKELNKSLSDWKKELQPLINKIARLIDYLQPCIATGSFNGKQNGGHYFSTKDNESIRFNLHNIHIQSEHSNKWKGGDNYRYSEGIKRAYGNDYLEYLNGLNQTKKVYLTVERIKEAKAICNEIIKELENDLKLHSPSERIELRNKLNTKIGIYHDAFLIIKDSH